MARHVRIKNPRLSVINIYITHEPNREAVNSIYDSMTDEEKIWLAGSVNNTDIPLEYATKEEYGPNGTLAFTSILWSGSNAIAFCDVWYNRPGEADIAVGTRRGHRGYGYAVKVIQEAIAWFRGSDAINTLVYYTHTDNVGSIALAKRLGFQIFFEDDQVTGLEMRK